MKMFDFIPAELNLTWVAGLAVVLSFGVAQIVKMLFDALLKAKKIEKEPWFRDVMLRGLSVVVGGLVGLVAPEVLAGVLVGMSCGIMNTTLFAVVKKKLKKLSE